MKFSDRFGYTEPKTIIQIDGIDSDLKNALWNIIDIMYLSKYNSNNIFDSSNSRNYQSMINKIWVGYFKKTIDRIPRSVTEFNKNLRDYFFNTEWYNIYNLLEFISMNSNLHPSEIFYDVCNKKLESELSGYRFVDGKITPIINEEEIKSIEDAILNSNQFKPVQLHLQTAIELFSNKTNPDYRNSIKESISAVESLVTILTNEPKLSLGQALKKLEDNDIYINKVFRSGLSTIYGYTSEEDGIRHGLLEESDIKQEDARFMLVICSSFTNYLIEKLNKAN
ncbi:AbiJ-NTD4 domain-containing protein [Chishuiella sp.]|uniref:AbiJ-NTD4 domain-containing protein n=1 Tax=Chishuiella sp. TaxID=1969467 RepID=UPI0028B09023|nr:hypothetical protein [Chishuiella sp.]